MTSDNAWFHSFWMGGFECCDHQNAFGYRVDFLKATGHLYAIDDDYARLEAFGIKTVREGIRWSQVETSPFRYDWSETRRIAEMADRHGIQVVWDICHFGYPDDLTPLHPLFDKRFASLCEAFARLQLELHPTLAPVIVPINEVSFISWLGGDVRGTCPYCAGQGWTVKYHLMKAFIEGVERIKHVLPNARIMMTEPLVNVVSASDEPEAVAAAREQFDYQYQAMDILVGRICPELRGRPEYLDIIGYDYYYNNQWEHDTQRKLAWPEEDIEPKRLTLSQLLALSHERYRKPFIIAETSHPREDRPKWMDMIGRNVIDVLQQGLPLLGVCIYPIIDRPDWDFLDRWHHAGLWDNPVPDPDPHAMPGYSPGDPGRVPGLGPACRPARVLNEPYAEALLRCQSAVAKAMGGQGNTVSDALSVLSQAGSLSVLSQPDNGSRLALSTAG